MTATTRSARCAASGQRVDAREHDVAQRLGHDVRAHLLGREQLFGEEGVSVRAFERLVDELARGGFAADGRDQLGDLVTVEAREIEAVRGTRTVELGEHRPERMAAVEVVGAERADHEHARVAQVAREEHEEVTRRVIGPVQVFEHEQRRHDVAEALQRAEQVFEEGGAVVDVVVRPPRELGEQAGERRLRVADHQRLGVRIEAAVQVAQRLDHRTERHRPVDELEAGARRDQPARGLDVGSQLADEAASCRPRPRRR